MCVCCYQNYHIKKNWINIIWEHKWEEKFTLHAHICKCIFWHVSRFSHFSWDWMYFHVIFLSCLRFFHSFIHIFVMFALPFAMRLIALHICQKLTKISCIQNHLTLIVIYFLNMNIEFNISFISSLWDK